MAHQTTYTEARAKLAELCDQVSRNRELVIIKRGGSEDVAIISADELTGLLETAHLLRSPRNTSRLLSALKQAKGRKIRAQSLDKLRRELGLGSKK